MSASAEVVAVLQADNGPGGVAALLTGGIYDYDTLPRLGLNRRDVPGAYDASGLLLPLAVLRTRTVTPSNRRDPDGYVAVDVTLDVTLLVDGNAGWGTLNAAALRIQALLDQKHTTSWWWLWQNEVYARDQNLSDACLLRQTYLGRGHRAW